MINPDSLKKHIKSLATNNFSDNLMDAVINMIHKIPQYKEEARVFPLRMFLGSREIAAMDIECNICILSVLSNYVSSNQIGKKIHEVAVICADIGDLCIIQTATEISLGVLTYPVNSTAYVSQGLIDNSFVLIEPFNETQVVVRNRNEFVMVSFSMATPKPYEIIPLSESRINNIWQGVFDKIKKSVHGTICLIVDYRWKYDPSDNIFKEGVTELTNINIPLEIPSSHEAEKFNTMMGIFINMLNYDGITILDTAGRIRAYHLFANLDNISEDVEGGARKRAYESLKKRSSLKEKGYIGIYFQSHENNIETYSYIKEESIRGRFDFSLMANPFGNPSLYNELRMEVTERFNRPKYFESVEPIDSNMYFSIIMQINVLHEIHNRGNNFYNEPAAAKQLYERVNTFDFDKQKKYKGLCFALLNVTLECYFGNFYGESWDAQGWLLNIINLVDSSIWDTYLSEYIFLRDGFAHGFITARNFNGRLCTLKNILIQNKKINEGKDYNFFDANTLRCMSGILSVLSVN